MTKSTIAVIFGSRSAEHDVSIITALATIIKPLEATGKYEVVPVYIAKNGKWYSDPRLKDINLYNSGKIDQFLNKTVPLAVQFDGGFSLLQPGFKNKVTKIDIVFPATHGTFGEDGDLMGILEMANVAYVGCNVASSALCMDKVLARVVAASENVPQNKYEWFYSYEFKADQKAVLKKLKSLKYPLFVKPTHLGSSIAITKVSKEEELINAIEVAAHYDDRVIVEEAVANLVEVTVPIIGNHDLTPANTEEPNQGDDFFDFETKYIRGGKSKSKSNGGAKQGAQGYSHIPARLDQAMREDCISIAKSVYRALGCSGIARVDLLIDKQAKKIYFNEVNPLPGSLYAHNWRSIGISNVELVERLVNLGLERYTENQQKETSFKTNFLKQF
jgi:D-alanine-D-alanine ligase